MLFRRGEGTIVITSFKAPRPKQKVRYSLMSEEFGPDFVTITDEDGNEFELEHVDTIEYKGNIYMAFFPADTDEKGDSDEEDEEGLIILKLFE